MASSIAAMTMPRSMDFSRATASAICRSSILLALTAAMALVSFAGIDVAAPHSLGGKAVFLGVFRGGLFLKFYLRFRRVAFGRIAFLGMQGRGRQDSEILLHLAFRDLAA